MPTVEELNSEDLSSSKEHLTSVSNVQRVGLVGVSGFANVHYQMIRSFIGSGQVRLLCAAIINQAEEPEKCQYIRKIGGEVFEDLEDMLQAFRGGLDLCFIPTGIHLHTPMAIAAMESGANVFIEKPAAATIQDVRAMQAVERRTGRFVAVGYQTMYATETAWMKNAILDGEIGQLRSIKSMGLWPRDDSYYSRNSWAGRVRVGEDWLLDSPFNNAIGHQLNMICFLAGVEFEKSAELQSIRAELYRARSIESADTACMRIETTNAVPLYFYVTHSSRTNVNPEIIVEGDRGRIHWTFDEVVLHRNDGSRKTMACQGEDSLRASIMTRLLAKLSGDSVFVCDLDIAAAQTICVNGAHESSEVHEIPSEIIHRYTESSGSVRTVVDGLDELIVRAHREGKLFSDLGVEWARAGDLIDLTGYDRFPKFRKF
jgi:predicted dehydrogenase